MFYRKKSSRARLSCLFSLWWPIQKRPCRELHGLFVSYRMPSIFSDPLLHAKSGDQSDHDSNPARDTAASPEIIMISPVPGPGPDRVNQKQQTVNDPADIGNPALFCQVRKDKAGNKYTKSNPHLRFKAPVLHSPAPFLFLPFSWYHIPFLQASVIFFFKKQRSMTSAF